MIGAMDARAADEGRSFLAKSGGGTKIGGQLLDSRVTIYSDPADPELPITPWANDGRKREKTFWFRNGVVDSVYYTRFWADKKGKKPVPPPSEERFGPGGSGFVMSGGDESTDDLVKGTKRGILITRLWYIRTVDPQTLLYTGLTRDGVFCIENGEIKYPLKNFRFNESPVIMLNNLEALGRTARVDGCIVPALKLRDFTFTSLSDAV
jgi:predicted Zn-dependent protease